MEKIKLYSTPVDAIGIDWMKMKCEVDDARKMNTYVKRAAKLFGASLVGICKLNRDVDIPEKFENVIVMAVEMDADGIATSPAVPAAAATGVGYVNVEQCYLYWCENGVDCSTCIKICPYNIVSARKANVTSKEFWNLV